LFLVEIKENLLIWLQQNQHTMRTKTILLALAILLSSTLLLANEEEPKKSDVKTGWNFGALPAVSFSSDLGFQYGALVNLFHYGDGSRYPNYNHSLYFEVSRFTKGSGLYRFNYDSDMLIPGIRTSFDMSYIPEQAADFYGFNGYESVYQPTWEDDTDPDDYLTRMFYKHERNMFRTQLDLSGALPKENLRWATGIEFFNFKVGSVDVDRLNKGQDEDKKLPYPADVPGLFENYINWGLIPQSEVNGGSFVGLKAGLVYDTRDFQPNPMKGIWTDVLIYAAPKPLSSMEKGFMRLSITHRQYFTLVPDKLSFVYRLSYQSNLGTKIPFYAQPLVITTLLRGAFSEGLGGQRTLRGVLRNRVVGDDFVYANAEFRWKMVRFRLLNQNIYIGLNPFVDVGQIVSPTDIEDLVKANVPAAEQDNYFNFGAEKPHFTAGTGLKIVMNENFIISADYGRTFNDQDGKGGIYIGLNYLF
jgi:hypothetical protein